MEKEGGKKNAVTISIRCLAKKREKRKSSLTSVECKASPRANGGREKKGKRKGGGQPRSIAQSGVVRKKRPRTMPASRPYQGRKTA